MIKRYLRAALIIGLLSISACSSFIKDKDADGITSKYQEGEYILLEDLTRNNVTLPKNSAVKLLVETSSDWVKVYAYDSKEELLKSTRVLLLYLFDSDFPNEKFNQEFFDSEVNKMVRPRGADIKPDKKIKK
ncbi:MAG: type II secretion system-associated lipoprotein [Spirochaetes bacterium]|nr:type II secretion system-associated lipoprotein [Spirochaetota bacterium]